MTGNIILGIIIVLVIIWIYFLQYYRIQTDEKLFVDDLIKNKLLKTGDLILFKAYDNFNSIFIGSYFGHVGVVVEKDGEYYLFEANGIEYMHLAPHHSRTGIFLSPIADRLRKYKGRCFWKRLEAPLEEYIIDGFHEFVDYCLNTFEYDVNVFQGGFRRLLGLSKCDNKTDCGQITFLSLIKLGLIDEDEYHTPRLHHLKYVCDINKLQNNSYLDLIEIIDHPFAY